MNRIFDNYTYAVLSSQMRESERIIAKARGEALYFRFGNAALDMLTHGIEAALAAENDTLALELDDALQAVERLANTASEQPHAVYVLDTSAWLH